MGIRGLTTFLLNYYDDEFFIPGKLHDCSLVIDGNNLRFMLYRWCHDLNSCLGGDYEKYRSFVHSFFHRLQLCNVLPVVVMDGAYDPSDIKLATSLKRARDQVKSAVYATPSSSGKCHVLPIFAKDVFMQTCLDLNLTVIQTNFEADAHMAQLSSKLKCPLLSNDSDFFVHDDVVLIPLDSLAFQVSATEEKEDGGTDNKGRKALDCKIFSKQKLMSHYGITNPRLLHLMSCLLGNDYVPGSTFDRFFGQVRLPKKKSLKPRYKAMEGLLRWLGREDEIDAAVERILNTIPKEEREKLRRKIAESLAMYEGQEVEEDQDHHVTNSVLTPSGHGVPGWLMKEFRNGMLPNWFMDVICNRVFFLQSQVEDSTQVSSHLFAPHVLRETCLLLTSMDEDYPKKIKLYTREGKTLRPVILELPEPPKRTLETLRGLSNDDKEAYLCQLVGVPIEKTGDCGSNSEQKRLTLLLLSIYAWTSIQVVTTLEMKVIAFSLAVTSILEKDCRDGIGKELRSRVTRFNATEKDMKAGTGGDKYSLEFVHRLSNLQGILYHLDKLCSLIGYPRWQPCAFWNGTFLFNVYNDLQAFRDGNRMEALFNFNQDMISTFTSFLSLTTSFSKSLNATVKFHGKKARVKDRRKQPLSINDIANKFSVLSTDE